MSRDQFIKRACKDLGIAPKKTCSRRQSEYRMGAVRAPYCEQKRIVNSYVNRACGAGGIL